MFFLYCWDGFFFCIFAPFSTWTKKHKNTLGFQMSIVLAISFSATLKFSPLRFQYSAKDRPCVFSNQREFPLMCSIFGAFAPLRFQSIQKCLLQKSMFRQHRPYVFNMLRKTALAFSVVSVNSLLCFQCWAQLRHYVFSPSTKMSLAKITVWTTPALTFSVCRDIPPQHNPSTNPPTTAMHGEFLIVFASFSLRFRNASGRERFRVPFPLFGFRFSFLGSRFSVFSFRLKAVS